MLKYLKRYDDDEDDEKQNVQYLKSMHSSLVSKNRAIRGVCTTFVRCCNSIYHFDVLPLIEKYVTQMGL